MDDETPKEELKVEDLKEIIYTHHKKEHTSLLEDYYDLIDKCMALKEENSSLKEVIQAYKKRKVDFRNRLFLITLTAALFATVPNTVKRFLNGRDIKKALSVEKQLNEEIKQFNLVQILGDHVENPNTIKLGSLFEEYVGIDLDDEKVGILNSLGYIAEEKYRLDSGDKSDLEDISCPFYLSEYIERVIHMDNPELDNYNINIAADGYMYADGKYQVNSDLYNSYILCTDFVDSRFFGYSDLKITANQLDVIIDTCLKATCYDVLADSDAETLDFSSLYLARKIDYQLPEGKGTNKNHCELPKVKVKSSTTL